MSTHRAEEARELFEEHIVGKNVMTPEALAYGIVTDWRGDWAAWEIAEGRGMKQEPIYGVTVLRLDTYRIDTSLGQLCYSWEDAVKVVAQL